MNFLEQINYNLEAGEHYQDASKVLLPDPTVRVIAFYLPQFHPIPENDKWWGKGFTEWTNVTKALPRFAGHYQPHLPGALGFYDLRLPDTLRAQAELARQFGIYGFCFHYYWFGGQKLLETPLNILLSNPSIDIQFCINWANESWSRRWDGSEADILMAQRFSEQDDRNFAAELERIVRDPRYIRIGDRPLIVFYRPRILPDPATTVNRWREQFQLLGLPNPYIVMAQAHGEEDPRPFGMDAAVGFPPHRYWGLPAADDGALQPFTSGFRGQLLSYDEMAQSAAEYDPQEYTVFPCVCPSWDNDARKPNRGVTFVGSNPRKYGVWLENACRKALRRPHRDEQLVFVNAWNEWAEGAHLEPDRHFGYAYLNETARVIEDVSSTSAARRNARASTNAMSSTAGPHRTVSSSIKRGLRRIAKKGATALERFATSLRSM